MGLLVAILLFPAAPAFLPRRSALLGYGVVLLVFGLLWLSLHGEPLGASSYRGMDALLLGGWGLVGLIGFCTVLVRRPLLAMLARKPLSETPAAPMALWPLPVGALLAVFFMHWLSNRLAGVGPAWLVHVLVAATLLGAGVGLWRFRPRGPLLRDLCHLGLAACAGALVWVGWGVWEAHRSAARAEEAAAGAPWCALAYAGRDHPRPARDILELSRLVSRSGGRGAMDDAHWLVVAHADGLVGKRWTRRNIGGEPHFEDQPIEGAAPCTAVPGGDLS